MLTSAATAYAERAWVLWVEKLVPVGSKLAVESAHPSLLECEGQLRSYALMLKKDGYAVTGDFAGPRLLLAKKDQERWTYRCLPDTVDPRNPKTK